MTTQLGFADVGVDPKHYHTVQSFQGMGPEGDVLLSGHIEQQEARDQLVALEGRRPDQYEWQFGIDVMVKSRRISPTIVEYVEDIEDEDFQLASLIRIMLSAASGPAGSRP